MLTTGPLITQCMKLCCIDRQNCDAEWYMHFDLHLELINLHRIVFFFFVIWLLTEFNNEQLFLGVKLSHTSHLLRLRTVTHCIINYTYISEMIKNNWLASFHCVAVLHEALKLFWQLDYMMLLVVNTNQIWSFYRGLSRVVT